MMIISPVLASISFPYTIDMTLESGFPFAANSEDTVCTNSPTSVFDGSESVAMKNLDSVVSVKVSEPVAFVISRTAGTEAISAPLTALTLIPQPRNGRAEMTVSADNNSAVSRFVSFLFMFTVYRSFQTRR